MRIYYNDLSSSFGESLIKQAKAKGHDIVGTVYDARKIGIIQQKWSLSEVVLYSNVEGIKTLVQSADVTIYSLLDHPQDALRILDMIHSGKATQAQELETNEEPQQQQLFIGISTVLTWSKNTIANAPPEGYSEDEFKIRKPARKFAEYKAVETQILAAARDGQLTTCILATGLLYGGKETKFDYLLQEAWKLDKKALPIPGIGGNARGDNLLPMMNIHDLALITLELSNIEAPPTKPYIIAVDQAQVTLRQITQSVSDFLGTGKITELGTKEANDLLLEHDGIGALQVNIKFNTKESLIESMGLPLEYGTGFVQNIAAVVTDYIDSMNLKSLRTIVLGPPQVGKTYYSTMIAKRYYLDHITIPLLMKFIQTPPSEDLLLCISMEELEKLQQEVKPFEENIVNLPLEFITQMLKLYLKQVRCRTHGYVLDGFPVSYAQAMSLFDIQDTTTENEDNEPTDPPAETSPDGTDDTTEATEDAERLQARKTRLTQMLLPTHVIVLDADETFLSNRAFQLSEQEAVSTGNTEVKFKERFEQFQSETSIENPTNLPLIFEKHGDIEVLELQVSNDSSTTDIESSINRYLESNGKPFNFHPTPQEQLELQKEVELRQAKEAAEQQAKQEELMQQELNEAELRQKDEKDRLECLAREEAELLEARSKPLRGYLMETVIPALTEGMLEVMKLQPDDPIDFLSEFLFQKGNEYEQSQRQ